MIIYYIGNILLYFILKNGAKTRVSRSSMVSTLFPIIQIIAVPLLQDHHPSYHSGCQLCKFLLLLPSYNSSPQFAAQSPKQFPSCLVVNRPKLFEWGIRYLRRVGLLQNDHIFCSEVEFLPPYLISALIVQELQIGAFIFQEILNDNQVGTAILLLTQIALKPILGLNPIHRVFISSHYGTLINQFLETINHRDPLNLCEKLRIDLEPIPLLFQRMVGRLPISSFNLRI